MKNTNQPTTNIAVPTSLIETIELLGQTEEKYRSFFKENESHLNAEASIDIRYGVYRKIKETKNLLHQIMGVVYTDSTLQATNSDSLTNNEG